MQAVLDSAGMREADRITIAELGFPSLALMEAAAAAVTDVVATNFAQCDNVIVACGPGNNGGDGLAVARQLRCRGFVAEAMLLVEGTSLKGDAGKQLELAKNFGVSVRTCAGKSLTPLHEALAGAEVVVDALFGTGLDRPLAGRWAAAVRAINACDRPVVAVDIPSGLLGSSAAIPGEAIEAAVTVTFAAPKLPHLLPPACWRCGEVAVGEIGIPPWVVDNQAQAWALEIDDIARWLPVRPIDAHKGHFGRLAIVAGRVGRAGAAALAARAAVTMGAGLVTVVTAEGAVAPIQAQAPEAMVDPVPQGKDGAMTGAGIAASFALASALAAGPGIGVGAGAKKTVQAILREWAGPLVLDADALTVLAGKLPVLRVRSAPTVLTPHPGELGRLLGWPTERVVADRLGAARAAAYESGAVVLAKGARTIVAEPSGQACINLTGTAGLASGGAGDVLTGVIGALLAQGVAARDAASAGAWLHGRAAEFAQERFPGAIPARALVKLLPRAEAEARTSS